MRDESVQSASRTLAGPPRWLTAGRIRFYTILLLLVSIGHFSLRIWFGYLHRRIGVIPLGWDFAVFWSASWLALHGPAVNAFDTALIEAIALPLQNRLPSPFVTPWAYPPTFLLAVLPAALLPFVVSYLLSLLMGMAFAFQVCARIMRPIRNSAYWLSIVVFPAVWWAAAAGQNSFLTFGLLGMGLLCLDRRPWLAGIFFGVLIIKPQLGLVIPVALLFGRQWRAIASAALTVGVFCALAGLALGFETYSRFVQALPAFHNLVVQHSTDWPGGISTVFGAARNFGASVPTALLVHYIVAALAMTVVAWLWGTHARFALRASALVLATMLVPYYLLYYDLLLLGLPILWLLQDGARNGWIRGDGVVMASAWFSPAFAYAPRDWAATAYAPIFVFALLLVVVRRGLAQRDTPACDCVSSLTVCGPGGSR
ncbi:glycosyltransferase family 87 protein [Paraburkholderia adhaesiva]|uniref:glycosyltransferase family 87 protein n=1 Tax=Paraburkholderia adhaesiva TaxID=2883244 RepID=UPI001F284F0C|nr:glycosyltransferase family 87 protein [Paraburkholderia adhaesiva]